MPGPFALKCGVKPAFALVQPTDLVASFSGSDLVLTFTPDGAAVEHDYRYLTPSTGTWSQPIRLPDAEESFAPNISYVFQVRGVDITGEIGPWSNGSIASFTVPVTYEFIAEGSAGDYSKTNDATSHTFTTGDFGDIEAETHLICIFVNRGAATRSLSSVTVNGVAADIRSNFAVGASRTGYFSIALTAGGVKTIVLNWDGTAQRCAIAPYKLENLISPINVSGGGTGDTSFSSGVLSGTVASVQAGSVLIGMVMNAAAGAFTWTELVEDFEAAPENLQFSTAGKAYANAATNVAITVTAAGPPSSVNPQMSVREFR